MAVRLFGYTEAQTYKRFEAAGVVQVGLAKDRGKWTAGTKDRLVYHDCKVCRGDGRPPNVAALFSLHVNIFGLVS